MCIKYMTFQVASRKQQVWLVVAAITTVHHSRFTAISLVTDGRGRRHKEQIVGDIEDEHDTDDIEDNIISLEDGKFRIRGITELEQVNEVLKTSFEDEDNDTLAGFILKKLGRVPHKGESLNIDNTHFEVQRADARQLHVLLASPITPKDSSD